MKGTARGKTTGSKVEIYDYSWAALNSWIETKIAKQMGAGISGFGCFCWEFTKTLTKDMVFTGVRDIIRKIGDFIFRGYDVCIDFTFGQLSAKERRVKFEFNINRLQQILPETISPDGLVPYDDALLPYTVTEEEDPVAAVSSRRERNDPSPQPQSHSSRASTSHASSRTLLPKLNLSLTSADLSKPPVLPPAPSPAPPLDTDHAAYETFAASSSSLPPLDEAGRPPSDDALPYELQDLLNAIAKTSKSVSKDEWRGKARERVVDQAFLRCLESVESDARSNERVADHARKASEDWKVAAAQRQVRSDEQDRQVVAALDSQVAEKARRREQEKLERLNSVVGLLVRDADPELGRQERLSVSQDQFQRILQNSQARQQQREDKVGREREYLKQLSLEIDLHNAMERAKHLEKQKALLEAWEREGHIRNLRKVETYGKSAVNDYIQGNLAETTSTLMFPAATLGKSLNRSIGYDPRRGKT
eukprot:gene27465-36242_t